MNFPQRYKKSFYGRDQIHKKSRKFSTAARKSLFGISPHLIWKSEKHLRHWCEKWLGKAGKKLFHFTFSLFFSPLTMKVYRHNFAFTSHSLTWEIFLRFFFNFSFLNSYSCLVKTFAKFNYFFILWFMQLPGCYTLNIPCCWESPRNDVMFKCVGKYAARLLTEGVRKSYWTELFWNLPQTEWTREEIFTFWCFPLSIFSFSRSFALSFKNHMKESTRVVMNENTVQSPIPLSTSLQLKKHRNLLAVRDEIINI